MKQALFSLLAVTSLVNCIEPAYADGNELLRRCALGARVMDGDSVAPPDQIEVAFCFGYLQGVLDMNTLNGARGASLFCPPAGVTVGQLARIVAKWLTERPEKLHEDGLPLTVMAIAGAFPCNSPR